MESGPITLVFRPGYSIAIANTTVGLYGFDRCPHREAGRTIYAGLDADSAHLMEDVLGCVVIPPEAKSVRVRLVYPDGWIAVEQWTVHHDAEHPPRSLYLTRPDGSNVLALAEADP
jgi:hypothetical protein